jgi:hypothetical protein
MTNERLRGAMRAVGMTPEDLGSKINVDPKTVKRWVDDGRTPYHTNRLAAATCLGHDDTYLWPNTGPDPRDTSASQAEFVAIYPNRGSLPDVRDSACANTRISHHANSF